MKTKAIIAALLVSSLALCSCGDTADSVYTHAPGATPYVRFQPQTQTQADTPTESYDTMEEFLESMYVREGGFFFIDWEKDFFAGLDQDAPYSFVVHPKPDWYFDLRYSAAAGQEALEELEEELKLEYITAAAEDFAAAGCDTKLRKCVSVDSGTEYMSYICVVTVTPRRLLELSGTIENLYFIEQLYKGVDQRFDETVWSSDGEGSVTAGG